MPGLAEEGQTRPGELPRGAAARPAPGSPRASTRARWCRSIAAAKEWFKANGGSSWARWTRRQDGRVKQVVALGEERSAQAERAQAKFYVKQGRRQLEAGGRRAGQRRRGDRRGRRTVEWWAEVAGPAKNQLMFLGSAGRPIKQTAPAAVAKRRSRHLRPPVTSRSSRSSARGATRKAPTQAGQRRGPSSTPRCVRSASCDRSGRRRGGDGHLLRRVKANSIRKTVTTDSSTAATTRPSCTTVISRIPNSIVANTLVHRRRRAGAHGPVVRHPRHRRGRRSRRRRRRSAWSASSENVCFIRGA